ncbi:MAG: photosynthetic reaction center subunit H [Rhizobiaceae bacterium]|nr:photosynthetic reaction center subunit H [Rhizobiaceae bacterium]
MVEIVGNIDVAQVVLYAFWLFFAGLIWYLQSESRREGYPLESDVKGEYNHDPFISLPSPKTFILPHGKGTKTYPNPENRDTRPIAAERTSAVAGSPLVPTGNPLKDGVGPAAWAERPDYPDLDPHGHPAIRPLSGAKGFSIAEMDTDPHGLAVIAADGQLAGEVTDVWVDTMECVIRYYQVSGENGNFLIPQHFALLRNKLRGRGKEFYVHALISEQLGDIPKTASNTEITMLEEEKIQAYFGGGMLYATPDRQEPLL